MHYTAIHLTPILSYTVCDIITHLLNSPMSSQDNRIGPICVSVCVCALSRLNHFTYGQEILHERQPGQCLGQVRWSSS